MENARKPILHLFQGKFKLPPPRKPIKSISLDNLASSISIPESKQKASKVVVFDLDETLGSFSDLFLLWSGIRHYYPTFDKFTELLDIFPEFLRYGIISILSFLKQKKNTRECDKIFIYTNNQCAPSWASLITTYLHNKIAIAIHPTSIENNSEIEIPLFDKIIGAFIPLKKSNKIPVRFESSEQKRTTNKKTYSDLIQCTMLPKNTEICFIDDTEYTKMKHDKIYYIQPKAYFHTLSVSEMIERLQEKYRILEIDISIDYWFHWFSIHGRNDDLKMDVLETEYISIMNKEVSKKMMFHIREFFLLSSFQKYRNKSRKGIKQVPDVHLSVFRRNTRRKYHP